MNAVIVSIGTELLNSDILDTNSARVTRRLRESGIDLFSKVTVGDDVNSIKEVLLTLLSRVDVIVTLGGLGDDEDDQTRQAIAQTIDRPLSTDPPGSISGAVLLAGVGIERFGLLLEEKETTLICLPGKPRDMAYLLDTEVMPYLQRRKNQNMAYGWVLLRTAGIMESNLEQQLEDLRVGDSHRLSLSSIAGQTDIGVWVEASSQAEVDADLAELVERVSRRLGDQIYGREGDLLEETVLQQLQTNDIRLGIAELHTDQSLGRAFQQIQDFAEAVFIAPATNESEMLALLGVDAAIDEQDLTHWCRVMAEHMLQQVGTDIGLVIYNNFTPGGVQLIVTLASPQGVSMMQRSFGGHPDNINQWAKTLGLVHVRRWLLAHFPMVNVP